MKKNIILCAVAGAFLLSTASVKAGEYSDALSQCLLQNTTPDDKVIMTKWIFSSLSNHPSVNSMANIPDNVRASTNQQMAQLIEKFMYDKCLSQVKNAVKNEGPRSIETSLMAYGQVAARDVLSDPSVTNSVTGLMGYLDAKKLFEALMMK